MSHDTSVRAVCNSRLDGVDGHVRRDLPGIILRPGLCQLITGVYLFVGMSWFQVFDDKVLFMAALAFSAYGIHWFALGWNRFQQSDPRPNGGMSIAFTIISVIRGSASSTSSPASG